MKIKQFSSLFGSYTLQSSLDAFHFQTWSCQYDLQLFKVIGAASSAGFLGTEPRGGRGAPVSMSDDKHHQFWPELISKAYMQVCLPWLVGKRACLLLLPCL